MHECVHVCAFVCMSALVHVCVRACTQAWIQSNGACRSAPVGVAASVLLGGYLASSVESKSLCAISTNSSTKSWNKQWCGLV